MHEEVMLLKEELSQLKTHQRGARTFLEGQYQNHTIILCLSGWGKAAAAATTASLIEVFKVEQILFVGLAGAIQSKLSIGDIVVGEELIQHDMELKGFTPTGEIRPPFYKNYAFETPKQLVRIGTNAAEEFKANLRSNHYPKIDSQYHPSIHIGTIGTGDQFVASMEMKQHIASKFPNILCTEMEGAAIAQIANDFKRPFLIIRVISDHAAQHAHEIFAKFLFQDISQISVQLIKILLSKM